jgi:hypothetical protein
MHIETEQFAIFGIVAEDGRDGVVRAHLFEPDLHAGDVAGVDLGAVFQVGDVGLGQSEDAQELRFERCAGCAEELRRQLQHATRIGDDLDRFDA